MKTLKMYLVALAMVFLVSSLMYAIAKLDAKRKSRARDARIQELEDALTECQAVYKEIGECSDTTEEVIKWKELAEQCVDNKVGIKAR